MPDKLAILIDHWIGLATHARSQRRGKHNESARLLDASPAAQVVTSENGTVLVCNREAARILGRPTKELLGRDLSHILSEMQSPLGESAAIGEVMAKVDDGRVHFPFRRPDGTQRILCATKTCLRTRREGSRHIVALSDITEQVQNGRQVQTIAERASYLATHDVLTALPNRALFLTKLEEIVLTAAQENTRFALLFIDLDNFKQVNDSLGHGVGDQLLKAVAARLRSRMEADEVLARLGGDEFILLLRTKSRGEALERAERVRSVFDLPFPLQGNSIYATGSFGLTLYPEHDLMATGLMQGADLAMYEAKAEGKNQVRIFDEKLRRAAARRSEVNQALRRALGGEGFRLVLQPKLRISAASPQLAGVEALLRWTDPVLGPVSPSEFIAVAEMSGLIGAIDLMVAGMVGAMAQDWERRGIHVPISFNVSASSLYNITADACLASALQSLDLPPGRVTIEITESTLMHNVSLVGDHLARLGAAGYRVSIDDFGTGYSSLSYLQDLPIQEVKIDRSFVSALCGPDNGRSTAIVASVLAIARALGLEAVAEGVEAEDQLTWLQANGCSQAQGFLFDRPLSVEEFEAGYLSEKWRAAG